MNTLYNDSEMNDDWIKRAAELKGMIMTSQRDQPEDHMTKADGIPYQVWMQRVDLMLEDNIGVDHSDAPDVVCWRDMFDNGDAPVDAVGTYFEEIGYGYEDEEETKLSDMIAAVNELLDTIQPATYVDDFYGECCVHCHTPMSLGTHEEHCGYAIARATLDKLLNADTKEK